MTALSTTSPKPLAPRPVTRNPSGVAGLVFPRLHLFQGVGKERQKYGNHVAGTYVLDITQTAVPLGTKLVPVGVVYKWQCLQNKVLQWRRASLDPRPPADIAAQCAWGPNGEKPLADSIIELVCVTDLCELPVVVQFKSTSFKIGKAFVSTWEILRRMAAAKAKGNPALSQFCYYELGEPKVGSNSDGEWKLPNLVGKGSLPIDSPLVEQVRLMAEVLSDMSEEDLASSSSDGDEPAPSAMDTPY